MAALLRRFASRDALLGELWLTTVLAYQEGFVAANSSAVWPIKRNVWKPA